MSRLLIESSMRQTKGAGSMEMTGSRIQARVSMIVAKKRQIWTIMLTGNKKSMRSGCGRNKRIRTTLKKGKGLLMPRGS